MEHKPILIRCYLWAPDVPWSPELTEELAQELAEFLSERGFANDYDEQLCSTIVLGGVDLPDTAEEWLQELRDDPSTSLIIFPGIAEDD